MNIHTLQNTFEKRDLETNIFYNFLGIPMIYQKFIMSLVAMGSVLFGGYFATLENKPSHTEQKTPVSATITKTGSVTESGTESDTFKRLKTVSESGSSWGMTPFGSGKPLTEEDTQTKKSTGSKPDLVWKTRTIPLKDGRWVTYEFGKGNPSAVALSAEELKAAYEHCKRIANLSSEDVNGNAPFCGEEDGYMSKETEQHLLAALSDPNWDRLLSECSEELKYTESRISGSGTLEQLGYFSYAQVLDPNFRNINDWITIDENTGRMNLNMKKLLSTKQFLYQATLGFWKSYNGGNSTPPYGNPTCVDVYGKEILRQLTLTRGYYISLLGNS